MNYEVTIKGLQEVDALIAKATLFFQKPEGLLNDLLFFQKTQILTKTAQGVDVDRDPFYPYSQKYALFRQAAGRPTARVDLFFSGEMLSSIKTKVTGREGTLFFADNESREKAYQLQEEGVRRKTGKVVKRQFFGVSKFFDVEGIDQIIEEHLDEALSGGK